MDEKKRTEIADLNLLRSVSELSCSPDGRYLAFVVKETDQKENTYKNNLWLKKEEEELACPLTFSGMGGIFLWQDGKTLLFAAERTKEDEPKKTEEKTCFYRLNVTGGEACRAFEIKKTVEFIRQVKPGLYCLGVREDKNALPESSKEEEREEELDYHVIEEVPAWGNGRGFIAGIRRGLFLFSAGSAEAAGRLSLRGPLREGDADLQDHHAAAVGVFRYPQQLLLAE